MLITGTFIDEITHDIPSQNWSEKEWRKEFQLYKEIGIDTAIIIRAGYKNKCIYASKVIPNLLPIYADLGEMFFKLGDEFGIDLFFGTYDSGFEWMRGSWWKEVAINLDFISEAAQRYGHHSSFKGWYICHETSRITLNIQDIFNALGAKCRSELDRPVLISPFPQGAKQFGINVMSLEESLEHWDRIFDQCKENIDICAFQDGQIEYEELPSFISGIGQLGTKHGVKIWSNLETFDRDMPFKFPPADW